jgi:hypothetical protein
MNRRWGNGRGESPHRSQASKTLVTRRVWLNLLDSCAKIESTTTRWIVDRGTGEWSARVKMGRGKTERSRLKGMNYHWVVYRGTWKVVDSATGACHVTITRWYLLCLTSDIHDWNLPGCVSTMCRRSANRRASEQSTGDPERQSLLNHDSDRSLGLMYFIHTEIEGTLYITELQRQ